MGGRMPPGLERGRDLVHRLLVCDDSDPGPGGELPCDALAPQALRVRFEEFRPSPVAPDATMPGDRPRPNHTQGVLVMARTFICLAAMAFAASQATAPDPIRPDPNVPRPI